MRFHIPVSGKLLVDNLLGNSIGLLMVAILSMALIAIYVVGSQIPPRQ